MNRPNWANWPAHPAEAAQRTPKPLSEADALHWESSARSLRLESKRARTYEAKQLHERDARNADKHAAGIRAAIAKAGSAA